MNTQQDQQAWEACPFCGEKEEIFSGLENEGVCAGLWFVKCIRCGTKKGYAEEEQDAINDWNKRAALQREVTEQEETWEGDLRKCDAENGDCPRPEWLCCQYNKTPSQPTR